MFAKLKKLRVQLAFFLTKQIMSLLTRKYAHLHILTSLTFLTKYRY